MEDTDICLRKRLMLLNPNLDKTSIFTSKQSKSTVIDLTCDTPNNHVTNFDENVSETVEDFSGGINLQPSTNFVSVHDSSDSELPCGLYKETFSETSEVSTDAIQLISGTRPQDLNSSQHDTSTFTLKDLKSIEIDLTSNVQDNSFTRLKVGSPKNAPKIPHEFCGTYPETDAALSGSIYLHRVSNTESASNSSDLDLPCEVFAETLADRLKLTKNRDVQDFSEVVPLPEIKDTATKGQKRGRHCSEIGIEKKLQAKLKAEEKAKEKQERQREREAKRLEKERSIQIKKAQQMSRKAFQPKECLKHMSVILDSAIVSITGLETAIVNICENLGSNYLIQSQQIPFVISWRRSLIVCDMGAQVLTAQKDIDEDEILVCLPLDYFVELVYGAKQKQRGEMVADFQTLQGYVDNVRQTYFDCSITLVVIGMENYFRKYKKSKTHKGSRTDTIISRLDVEEALVNLQLRNLCNCQLIESIEDMADIVRTFTKAVAEKPMKKDRLQSEFTFHNEKVGGNASDNQSLWKTQLEQFKNISNDISSAIVSHYPSPKSLVEAYKKCSSEKECIKLLENIMVRRKAGILETSRRVGKEASRRIYLLMTTTDADLVLK